MTPRRREKTIAALALARTQCETADRVIAHLRRAEAAAAPSVPGLTRRQAGILAWFSEYSRRAGVPPTTREVAAHFGITARTAYDHLLILLRKRALHRRTARPSARVFVVHTDRP